MVRNMIRVDILRVAWYFFELRRGEEKYEQNIRFYYLLKHQTRDILFHYYHLIAESRVQISCDIVRLFGQLVIL